LVFEDGEHGLGAIEQRIAGTVDVAVEQGVEDLAVGLIRECAHLVPRRPAVVSRVRKDPAYIVVGSLWTRRSGRLRFMRVDTAGEERLEPRVDARAAETFLDQGVEAESRQVAFIEHDRMTQRDRAAVVRVNVEEIEKRARAFAVAPVPRRDGLTVDSHPTILI